MTWCPRHGQAGYPTATCDISSAPILMPPDDPKEKFETVCLWCNLFGHTMSARGGRPFWQSKTTQQLGSLERRWEPSRKPFQRCKKHKRTHRKSGADGRAVQAGRLQQTQALPKQQPWRGRPKRPHLRHCPVRTLRHTCETNSSHLCSAVWTWNKRPRRPCQRPLSPIGLCFSKHTKTPSTPSPIPSSHSQHGTSAHPPATPSPNPLLPSQLQQATTRVNPLPAQ